MREQKRRSRKSSIKENVNYVQDWLPIENNINGMFVIKDSAFGNRYVKVLEVMPTNFHLKSNRDKNYIIEMFRQFVKIAPKSFQICLTTMDTDTTEMVNHIKKATVGESELILDERNKYIDKIKSLSSKDAIRKRCLIVYDYEGSRDGTVSTDVYQIASEMEETKIQLQTALNRMGNRVVAHDNEERFLAEVMYRYLNKHSIRTEGFEERVSRIYYDSQKIQHSAKPEIDVRDYFAPRGIDDSNPDFCIIDGIYHTYMYLNPRTYPVSVIGGWIDIILDYGNTVDISLHFKKRLRERELSNLKRGMRFNQASLNSKNEGDEAVEGIVDAYHTSSFIRQKMQNDGEDLYDGCIMLDIMATNYDELKKIRSRIKSNLKGYDIYLGECYARCLDAEKMMLPINYKDGVIFKKASRNFLTSSIASTYPFTQYELFDPKGVLFGINALNSSLVSINLFNTKMFKNANAIILGSSGSGKTFLEQLLGRAMRLTGMKVMFVLPMKGHEYQKGCEKLGGTYIKLSPGTANCVNLFEIRPESRLDENMVAESAEYIKASLLSKKMTQIKTFIQLLMRGDRLSVVEENYLDDYLTRLYSSFGITNEEVSIYNEDGSLKTMPIFSDFYNLIKDDKRMEKVASSMIPFVNGTCRNMNGQTNVNLDNKYIIFDVDADDIPESLHPAFLFIATDLCYDAMKKSRTEECVLFLDEVWRLMVNEFSSEFIFKLTKIVRGYGSSVVVATQDLADFLSFGDGKYGKQILNNATNKIVLSMEYDSVEYIQDILNLNDTEKKDIVSFERGSGMLISNKDRLSIYFTATQDEIDTFTTDINVLKRIQSEKEQSKEEAIKRTAEVENKRKEMYF